MSYIATAVLKTKVTSVKQVQQFQDLVNAVFQNHNLRHEIDVQFVQERACVHCGCTDSSACKGGCSWIIIHTKTNTGVCSQCVPKLIKIVDSL